MWGFSVCFFQFVEHILEARGLKGRKEGGGGMNEEGNVGRVRLWCAIRGGLFGKNVATRSKPEARR